MRCSNPGLLAEGPAGAGEQVTHLAKAGLSQGLAGLFLEAHPDPNKAKCDGPCALRLDTLEPFLRQMKALDELIKAQPELVTQ